jgi:hypothetical protein
MFIIRVSWGLRAAAFMVLAVWYFFLWRYE